MLVIHNVQLIDRGQYRCVAVNSAGNSSKEFVLDVLGK